MKPPMRKLLKLTLVTALTGLTLVAPVSAAEDIHKVRQGESLWSIARQHNIDVDTLARINGITNAAKIAEGMELKLTEEAAATPNAVSYTIKEGETLWSIARINGIPYKELVEFNQITEPDRIFVGMQILIPGAAAVNTSAKRSRFVWPAKGRISSEYGPRWGKVHEGIDISLPVGRNVIAAASGKVVWSGSMSGYGLVVIIEHEDGYRTLYGHNSRLVVSSGDWVEQGQLIALSGNTGRSTGPHLHFEVQKNGKPVDPLNYLN